MEKKPAGSINPSILVGRYNKCQIKNNRSLLASATFSNGQPSSSRPLLGTKKVRVVVYEPQFTGHHYAHLARLLPALAELTPHVVLATSEQGASSPQFKVHLDRYAEMFQVATPWRFDGPFEPRQLYRGLRAAVDKLSPDHLYVSYGDGVGPVCGLNAALGRRAWPAATEAEVLLLRGNYIYPTKNWRTWLQGQLAMRLLRRGAWKVVHHMVPEGAPRLAAGDPHPARYQIMPDPVDTLDSTERAAARAQLGIPLDGRYVGTTGVIDHRKGVPFLLDAFRRALPQLQADDRLLLAGAHSAEVVSLLEGEYRPLCEQGRIVTIRRHLTAAEWPLALAALDLVCALYPSHPFSASIVIQATAVERPVLGANYGWMGHTIRQFGLGDTCDVNVAESRATALVAALQKAAGYRLPPAAREFVRFHSPANFIAHWTARLRQRLGAPQSAHLLAWDEVLRALQAEQVTAS